MKLIVVLLCCLACVAGAKRYEIGQTGVSLEIPASFQMVTSAVPPGFSADDMRRGINVRASVTFPAKSLDETMRNAQFVYRNSGGSHLLTQGYVRLAGQQWVLMEWLLNPVSSRLNMRTYRLALPNTKSGQGVSVWFELNTGLAAQNESLFTAMVNSIRVR